MILGLGKILKQVAYLEHLCQHQVWYPLQDLFQAPRHLLRRSANRWSTGPQMKHRWSTDEAQDYPKRKVRVLMAHGMSSRNAEARASPAPADESCVRTSRPAKAPPAAATHGCGGAACGACCRAPVDMAACSSVWSLLRSWSGVPWLPRSPGWQSPPYQGKARLPGWAPPYK